MSNSPTNKNTLRSVALTPEDNNNIYCLFEDITDKYSEEFETEEGVMRQVAYVYDNGAPYVRTISIYPNSGVFHFNISIILVLRRRCNNNTWVKSCFSIRIGSFLMDEGFI